MDKDSLIPERLSPNIPKKNLRIATKNVLYKSSSNNILFCDYNREGDVYICGIFHKDIHDLIDQNNINEIIKLKTSIDISTPFEVLNLKDKIIDISCGKNFICSLNSSGEVLICSNTKEKDKNPYHFKKLKLKESICQISCGKDFIYMLTGYFITKLYFTLTKKKN